MPIKTGHCGYPERFVKNRKSNDMKSKEGQVTKEQHQTAHIGSWVCGDDAWKANAQNKSKLTS